MTETIYPGAPLAPGTQVIASPTQFLFTGSEALRVICYTMVPGTNCVLQGRFRADSDGAVKPFSYELDVPNATLTGQTFEIAFPAGTLLNVRLALLTANAISGTQFAQVQQIVGLGSAATVIGTLLQGYLSPKTDLGWPGSALGSVHDGRGALVPALWTISAGPPLQASYTPAAGLRAALISGEVLVTTSAVVADRTVQLLIRQAGGTENIAVAGAGEVLPASTGRGYVLAPGLIGRALDADGVEWLPVPSGLEISGSTVILLQVVNAQAGDAINQLNTGLSVRLWFDV